MNFWKEVASLEVTETAHEHIPDAPPLLIVAADDVCGGGLQLDDGVRWVLQNKSNRFCDQKKKL